MHPREVGCELGTDTCIVLVYQNIRPGCPSHKAPEYSHRQVCVGQTNSQSSRGGARRGKSRIEEIYAQEAAKKSPDGGISFKSI